MPTNRPDDGAVTHPPAAESPRALPAITPDRVPSLSIIEDALQREDDSYRDRANGLDTKAGVILSAAGVIVTLVGIHSSIAGLVGQLIAIASGAAAVWTLAPRVDKAIGPRQLRDRYLQIDALTTRLIVLNTRIDLHERNEKRLFDKAFRMKIAAGLLLGSAAAIGVGGILNVIWH
jgi:hypothetical protein